MHLHICPSHPFYIIQMIGGAVNLYLYSYILKCCLHIFSKKRKLLSARICKPAKCQPFPSFSTYPSPSVSIQPESANNSLAFATLYSSVLTRLSPYAYPTGNGPLAAVPFPLRSTLCKFFLIYRTCYSFSDIGILKTLCCIVHLRKMSVKFHMRILYSPYPP